MATARPSVLRLRPRRAPSTEVSPWRLGGLTVGDLARRVYADVWSDELPDRAAALTYYFLFALFPGLLFLTALIGLVPSPELMIRFMTYVKEVLPDDASSLIMKTLDEVVRGAGRGLLSVGAVAALWAASAGMSSLMSALNAAYEVEDPRPWWTRRLLSVVLTVGFSAFVLTALALLVFGPKIGDIVASWLGLGWLFTEVWNVLSWPAVIFFALTGIGLAYYFAPAAQQHWKWVTPGSVFVLVVWLAASMGLRYYVRYLGNYNATYGSIGGVILLLLWLYVSSLVLLLGAEINSEIENAAARRGNPEAKAAGELEAPADRVAAG
jgi:membrane protein